MSSPEQPSAPPVPSPSNPVLVTRQSQWIFTDAELQRAPSLLDGMDMETEHMFRSKGVNFITQVGVLLKLPQLTLSTASVYLHRFFMRYSMVDLPQRPGMHPYSIAATSLFLATKVEENCRKLKELIVACCRIALKQPSLVVDEQSKEFWKWRDTILHNEDLLLEALCFDLQLEQPYRLLYDFLCYFRVQDDKRIRNASWAFVNDSTFCILCLQYNARTIAAAALYAAVRHCNATLEDDNLGRPWWEQIDVDVAETRRACNRLAELYEKYPLPNRGLKYPTSPINGEDAGSAETARQANPRTAEGSVQSQSQSPGEVNGQKRERDAGAGASTHPNTILASNGTQQIQSDLHDTERSPKRRKRETSEPQIDTDSSSQTQLNQSSQSSFAQATAGLNIASTQTSHAEDTSRNRSNNPTASSAQNPPPPPESATESSSTATRPDTQHGPNQNGERPSTSESNQTAAPRPPPSAPPGHPSPPTSRIPAGAHRKEHPLPRPPAVPVPPDSRIPQGVAKSPQPPPPGRHPQKRFP